VDQNELITLAGVFFGGLLAGAVGYFKKQKPVGAQTAVLTGVGMELGNKEQIERLIHAVEKIAKAIHDEEQDEFKLKMEHLLEALERAEQRPQR